MAVTKEQIAEAFRRRVDRFGYRKSTVDELAADLHISKKTIYVHFATKAEIYRHIVEGMAAESRQQLLAAVAPLPTAGERFEALTRMVLETARAHVLETDRAEWEAEFTVAADAFRVALGSAIRELVQAGIESGEFAIRDADMAERLLAAMLIEHSVAVREDAARDWDEDLVAAVRRFVG